MFKTTPNSVKIPHFRIVTPGRNCEKWIYRCLKSIQRQSVDSFVCVFIDDASTDRTFAVAQKNFSSDQRFRMLQNETRQYPLGSIRRGTTVIAKNPDDVIVIVDGDDWLKHPRVLERIAEAYKDPNVWLTYGSHELYRRPLKALLCRRSIRGIAAPYPKTVLQENAYRRHPFICSHLRTYRKFLWDAIDDEDLKDESGCYYQVAGDAAAMWPMLEMATAEHIHYIEEILYVYNNNHSYSENRPQILPEVVRVAERLVSKSAYRPLSYP